MRQDATPVRRRARGLRQILPGLGLALWASAAWAASPGPPPVSVLLRPVVQQATKTTLDVVGTVEPSLMTTVSAEIGCLVLRFDLREGEGVQQGKTVLMQCKATDLELTLAEAEAELAKVREAVKKLKSGLRPEEIDEKRAELQERKTWLHKSAKDLERMQSMRTRDIASSAEHEQAESAYLASKAQYERVQQSLRVAELGTRLEDVAAAEAEVQRLQARSQRLREDVQKATLRAPVSGIVTRRHTEVGQWLERGGKVVDLVVLNPVLVQVPVPEKDISRLRVGDEATLMLDALPDRKFTGRVKHIIPQADLASRTFPVKIEVANTADFTLKAGMFARVALRAGATNTGLFLPKDAVVRRAVGQVVFTVHEGKARQVPVKIGRAVDDLVEVIEGNVKAGDMVVVTGNEALQDQAAVLVKDVPRN